MAKVKSIFVCQECAEQAGKWLGRCPSCGAWDSFVESIEDTSKYNIKHKKETISQSSSSVISMVDIKQENNIRYSTYDDELDLVLGGGIVVGSLVLVGGAPGVGKSTLLLKVAGNMAKKSYKTLYISGEESSSQIKLRSKRVDANSENIFLLPEISLEKIFACVNNDDYDVLIVDSIQTLYSESISSAPGSVSQVREVTFMLMRLAKEKQIPIFIIGHITKEGSIAGPRVLEHMVDVVLYFDNNQSKDLRILRAFKNRFGSTNEIAIFQMQEDGLSSVKNFSTRFLDIDEKVEGSALSVLMEGSRALIVEVQALVSESSAPNPKRSSNGFDSNRLTMLLALLEKKMGLAFGKYDVFINITGGIKITEPSADAAVVAAIISSLKNRPLNRSSIFIGEVSLTGDIRSVHSMDIRVKEALNQGYDKIVLREKLSIKNIKYFEVDKVEKIINWM